jgi:hypothetical protein
MPGGSLISAGISSRASVVEWSCADDTVRLSRASVSLDVYRVLRSHDGGHARVSVAVRVEGARAHQHPVNFRRPNVIDIVQSSIGGATSTSSRLAAAGFYAPLVSPSCVWVRDQALTETDVHVTMSPIPLSTAPSVRSMLLLFITIQAATVIAAQNWDPTARDFTPACIKMGSLGKDFCESFNLCCSEDHKLNKLNGDKCQTADRNNGCVGDGIGGMQTAQCRAHNCTAEITTTTTTTTESPDEAKSASKAGIFSGTILFFPSLAITYFVFVLYILGETGLTVGLMTSCSQLRRSQKRRV